jgi:hypothetical protein
MGFKCGDISSLSPTRELALGKSRPASVALVWIGATDDVEPFVGRGRVQR